MSPQPEPRPGRKASGVLLLYNRPALFRDAATITDHIDAFGRYSSFDVHDVNTDGGFPKTLAGLSFDAIVLHYSVFASGPHPYLIGDGVPRVPPRRPTATRSPSSRTSTSTASGASSSSTAIRVDCVYTCFEPEWFEATYGTYTRVPKLVSHVPAYVSPDMVEAADRLHEPDAERSIDVGYRTRPTPPYFGRGGMEKVEIGERFAERAAGSGLALDISAREEDRLYGEDWYRFIADCRGHARDRVRRLVQRPRGRGPRASTCELSKGGRDVTIEDLERGSLGKWDWKVPLRTTSSRHFEAAAMRVCQIMYEGEYSGVLKPMVHYIPLRKDFSELRRGARALPRPGRPRRDHRERPPRPDRLGRPQLRAVHRRLRRDPARGGPEPGLGAPPPAPAIRGPPGEGARLPLRRRHRRCGCATARRACGS